MAKRKDFERTLQKAAKQQAYWLRRAAGLKPRGKAPALTKTNRRRFIERLEKTALQMNVRRLVAAEFKAGIDERKSWRVTTRKGFGVDQKKKNFGAWFQKNIKHQSCVYVFWGGIRCCYVGRTLEGKGRPHAHYGKYWFGGVTRIDIYSVRRASLTPKLECLAVHRWKPAYPKYKPAERKWTKKCPICKMLHDLRTEARRAFPLRRKRKSA